MAKRMTRDEKITEIMLNCYRELFANSTPVGDFDKLMEEATINEHGQKVIPFMDYEIDQLEAEKIIDKYAEDKLFKKNAYYQRSFKISIYLGCSPKFKTYERSIKIEK